MAIMAASKKPTNVWAATDLALGPEELGFDGSLIDIVRSSVTVGERRRIVLQGEAREIAPKIAKALVQEGVLKAA
jgi:electron transfer flavoprotein alpha/beta subunit